MKKQITITHALFAASLLAVLMTLLQCAEWGFEYNNPCDERGTNYQGCGVGNNGGGGGGGDDNYVYTGGTVRIGNQTWMAKNLDRATANSKCYNNSPDSCAKYGRLYNWNDAKSACPSGWHLPTDDEWTTLESYVEEEKSCSNCAAKFLKSQSDWYSCGPSGSGKSYVCEDAFGFSALPGGIGDSDGTFDNAGIVGFWWSSTEYGAYDAYWSWGRDVYFGNEYVTRSPYDKDDQFSVRCVQD